MSNNYINRELSWLKFNKRVLEESQSASVPDYEKLKFIAIFTSNLDEFFMVRAGSMYDRSHNPDDTPDNKTGMTAAQQLDAIYKGARPLYRLRDVYFADVTRRLGEHGIFHRSISSLEGDESKFLKKYFKNELLPLLMPQIVDAKHPCPHLDNKKLYIVVTFKDAKASFGIIPVPGKAIRTVFLPSCHGIADYVLAEDIILRYAGDIFKSYSIAAKAVIRITRSADIEVDDNFRSDELDYREYVNGMVKKREKLEPVRMETYFGCHRHSDKLVRNMLTSFGLTEREHYGSECPLDMSYVFANEDRLVSVSNTDAGLFYSPLLPQYSREFDEKASIMERVMEKDFFLSYPFYSMKPYLKLLREAADDPDAISIKITLYRLSNNSEVVDSLCRAAENGKEVTAVVELKARFDEANNINWSKKLEDAGCNIIYGIDGLKIHSKITLVTFRREGELKYITHIGTGNYNEKTAKSYTDVGIMTSDSRICTDAVNFFRNITLGLQGESYRHLWVAPNCLKNNVIRCIREQVKLGSAGYLRFKMNSLTDKEIMDELIEASKAGVRIDLIIRGICCLQPGIPGLSENIRVYSIVGRFLEHSRIYIFGSDPETRKVYIGSADFMTRNTTRRIEIIAPVYDRTIAGELAAMTDVMLRDNVKRTTLCTNGEYEHVITGRERLDCQIYFFEKAYEQQ